MRIRFTEFLRKDDEEISLYVIQESNGDDYTVHVRSGENKQIIFFEKMGNRWNMLANNLPQWVLALKPMIVRTIEYRMLLEVRRNLSANLVLSPLKNVKPVISQQRGNILPLFS